MARKTGKQALAEIKELYKAARAAIKESNNAKYKADIAIGKVNKAVSKFPATERELYFEKLVKYRI
jgi:selenocysteine lyase/cysteine desulfurase